ncbi:hypothetical protein ACEQ8A_004200 [Vibrio fluvialis]
MAMTVGCNDILNFHIRRETFSEGNYNYTMHAALGTLALISELVPCSSEAEVEQGEEEIREAIAQFDTNFSIVNERETKIRYNQEGWPVPRWFVPGLKRVSERPDEIAAGSAEFEKILDAGDANLSKIDFRMSGIGIVRVCDPSGASSLYKSC